jgi:hypothetical protein
LIIPSSAMVSAHYPFTHAVLGITVLKQHPDIMTELNVCTICCGGDKGLRLIPTSAQVPSFTFVTRKPATLTWANDDKHYALR